MQNQAHSQLNPIEERTAHHQQDQTMQGLTASQNPAVSQFQHNKQIQSTGTEGQVIIPDEEVGEIAFMAITMKNVNQFTGANQGETVGDKHNGLMGDYHEYEDDQIDISEVQYTEQYGPDGNIYFKGDQSYDAGYQTYLPDMMLPEVTYHSNNRLLQDKGMQKQYKEFLPGHNDPSVSLWAPQQFKVISKSTGPNDKSGHHQDMNEFDSSANHNQEKILNDQTLRGGKARQIIEINVSEDSSPHWQKPTKKQMSFKKISDIEVGQPSVNISQLIDISREQKQIIINIDENNNKNDEVNFGQLRCKSGNLAHIQLMSTQKLISSSRTPPPNQQTGMRSLKKSDQNYRTPSLREKALNHDELLNQHIDTQNQNDDQIMQFDESPEMLQFKKEILQHEQEAGTANKSKRGFRGGNQQRSQGDISVKNQLSYLGLDEDYDDMGIYAIEALILRMQPVNTESLIQIKRNYDGDANSLENNRGGLAGVGERAFEGFETPTSSQKRRGSNQFKIHQNPDGVPDGFTATLFDPANKDLDLKEGTENLHGTLSEKGSIISMRNSQHVVPHIITKYDARSLFLFKQESCFRQRIIRLVDSKSFEYVLVLVILLNSLSLAMYDYGDRDSNGKFNRMLDASNIGFTAVFIFEALLKIIAKGFVVHGESYLRNGWNLIDSVVVISGILELTFGSVKLKALRVVRVFRPLKSINVIPSMKKLIQALIQSIPDFANVGTFLVYVFILFATMGLHQYNGVFYNVCRFNKEPETKDTWAFDPNSERICSQSGLGNYICPNNQYCGNNREHPEISLQNDQIERRDYINYGITNFDNIGTSLLSVFQIINSDTWYKMMTNFMDVDIPFFGALFCLMMIIVGQFFLMNLILAVIIFAFIKTQKKEIEIEILALGDDKTGDTILSSNNSENNNASLMETGRAELVKINRSKKTQIIKSKQQTMVLDSNNKLVKKRTKRKKKNMDDNFASFLKPHVQKKKVANMFLMWGKTRNEKNMTVIEEGEGSNQADDSMNPFDDVKNELSQSVNYPGNSNFVNSTIQASDPVNNQDSEDCNILALPNQAGISTVSADQINIKILENQKSTFNRKNTLKQLPLIILEPANNSDDLLINGMDRKKSLSNNNLNAILRSGPSTANDLFNRRLVIDRTKTSPLRMNDGGSSQSQNSKSAMENLRLNVLKIGNTMGANELQKRRSLKQIEKDSSSVVKKNNNISRAFRRFIRKKIEQEYERYFKQLIEEAKENYYKGLEDDTFKQINMRELSGLKIGLEYMKKQKENLKRMEDLDQIEERARSNKAYLMAYQLTESNYYIAFMAVCIILNTLVLALDKYPENFAMTKVLEKINIIFTVIFITEMGIKTTALGFKTYFKGSAFNVFDAVIVLASTVDIFLSNFVLSSEGSNSGSVITALRGFRLLRIFKLAKSWKRFELLLETLGRTLVDIATFTILLFLFIFTFTLFGLELFAHRAKFNIEEDYVDMIKGVSPKYNFDNFQNSFTTVFIVLTNENMSEIYYNHYRTVGAAASTVFFILLVIIGQKILLNLFLAILLENFDEGALKQNMHELQQNSVPNIDEGLVNFVKNKVTTFVENNFQKLTIWMKSRHKAEQEAIEAKNIIEEENRQKLLKNLRILGRGSKGALKNNVNEIIAREKIGQPILEGKSFNLFAIDNRPRQFLFYLVNHKRFDFFIILVIVLSAIQLAMDSPIYDPQELLKRSLFWIDLGTTIIFLIEALFKVMAYGFLFNGKSSYLRQYFNVLDFVIILFSLLSLTPLSDNLRSFKIFRVLRLLRLISRNQELKVAMGALVQAVPNVANVTIIMMLFFLIFGIIAVSYFKGKLYYCENQMDDIEGVRSKWDCLSAGGEWLNEVYGFDNVINALVTLFVMSTVAGWADIMLKCATSTEIDYIQGDYKSPVWIFFFIVFIIVGAFFFLNLFVGVVISTFNSEHDKLGGNDLLTEKQKEWIDLRLLVLRSTPQRKLSEPVHPFRKVIFKISTSTFFDRFILVCICLNTVVLMFKWYQQPRYIDLMAEILNYFFTVVFIFEAAFKLIGIGPRIYFSEGWNCFDFVIIIGSFVSIFISANTSLEIRGAITILRSFRILRLLRLIKRGKSLQLIFNTFVITLHSLANIGALLLLFIFIYAILGMIIFGETKRNGSMDAYINFETFQNSFITLFIAATGDAWDLIMEAYSAENSPIFQCIENPNYHDYKIIGQYNTVGCGNKNISYIYFLSYTFVVNLVFLKIFIAIILQGYNDTQTQDGRLFNHDMNDKFMDTWTEYDPDATSFINLCQLREFLFALGRPLGFDETFKKNRFRQDQFIASLELPTYHGFSTYQFLDILDALSFRLMVLDHIQKNPNKGKQKGDGGGPSSFMNINKDQERDIKDQLSKEVNKLIFQKQSENISAVREVSEKETRRLKNRVKNRDKSGLTSIHHMAAEATVRKMKMFLKHQRGIPTTESSFCTDSGNEEGSYSSISQQQIDNGALSTTKTNLLDLGNTRSIIDASKLGEHLSRDPASNIPAIVHEESKSEDTPPDHAQAYAAKLTVISRGRLNDSAINNSIMKKRRASRRHSYEFRDLQEAFKNNKLLNDGNIQTTSYPHVGISNNAIVSNKKMSTYAAMGAINNKSHILMDQLFGGATHDEDFNKNAQQSKINLKAIQEEDYIKDSQLRNLEEKECKELQDTDRSSPPNSNQHRKLLQ